MALTDATIMGCVGKWTHTHTHTRIKSRFYWLIR